MDVENLRDDRPRGPVRVAEEAPRGAADEVLCHLDAFLQLGMRGVDAGVDGRDADASSGGPPMSGLDVEPSFTVLTDPESTTVRIWVGFDEGRPADVFGAQVALAGLGSAQFPPPGFPFEVSSG